MDVVTMWRTGYFANPATGSRTLTHVVGNDMLTLCGARVGHGSAFQFCATGIKWDYLNCARCRRVVQSWLADN